MIWKKIGDLIANMGNSVSPMNDEYLRSVIFPNHGKQHSQLVKTVLIEEESDYCEEEKLSSKTEIKDTEAADNSDTTSIGDCISKDSIQLSRFSFFQNVHGLIVKFFISAVCHFSERESH